MAYCFYNGVKLPELPSTAYAYCWIRKNDNTQHYDLIFTKVLGYYDASASGIVYGANQGTTEIAHYRIAYSDAGTADSWDNYQTTNTWMALDANRTVMWSNHYIPNGSLTATEMYFDGSEAIPEVEAYQIEKDTVVGIADQVRRLCNTENTMTPAEMESNLKGLNIDLMETFVISTEEEQVIYPDEGYYGFSKITVGAVDLSSGDSGGDSGGGGTGGGDTGGESYVSSDGVDFGSDFTVIPAPPDDNYPYKIVVRHKTTGGISMVVSSTSWYHYTFDSWGTPVVEVATDSTMYGYPFGADSWGELAQWYLAIRDDTYDVLYTNYDITEGKNGTEIWMAGVDTYSNDITCIIGSPLDRNETYTIEGDKLNDLIGTAQKITGSYEPMTVDEAIEVLTEFESTPIAEGVGF